MHLPDCLLCHLPDVPSFTDQVHHPRLSAADIVVEVETRQSLLDRNRFRLAVSELNAQ